jgi:hypothetical protein
MKTHFISVLLRRIEDLKHRPDRETGGRGKRSIVLSDHTDSSKTQLENFLVHPFSPALLFGMFLLFFNPRLHRRL